MVKSYKKIRLNKAPKLFLVIVGLLIITSCDKNDDQIPLEQLPPATQTGAQTFGCLINGKPFIPPLFGSNSPRAFYQFARGAYTLGISAGKGGGVEMVNIFIGAIDINGLQVGEYSLIERKSGNYFGTYLGGAEAEEGWLSIFSTSNGNPGVLNITNFDPEKFIISGTFSFTLIDENGEKIQITDGRFDMNFTN